MAEKNVVTIDGSNAAAYAVCSTLDGSSLKVL